MALTKADLRESIRNRLGISKSQSAILVESLLETIKESLEAGEHVNLSGFGKFCVKEKNERRGRNPATGHDLVLDSRRVVTFKCSSALKDKINGNV